MDHRSTTVLQPGKSSERFMNKKNGTMNHKYGFEPTQNILPISLLLRSILIVKPRLAMDCNGGPEPSDSSVKNSRAKTCEFRHIVDSLLNEWERIFRYTFLPKIPYEDGKAYEERLAYAKEIFLYPVVEGFKAIADHYEKDPDNYSLPNISLKSFEILLGREYLWRLFFYGNTGVLIETPPCFDPKHFMEGYGEMDIPSLFHSYHLEWKFAAPSERKWYEEEGYSELQGLESYDDCTGGVVADFPVYNKRYYVLSVGRPSFRMERPSIITNDMVNQLQPEIASYRKRYLDKAYLDIWISIDAFRNEGQLGIGRDILLDEQFTDMLALTDLELEEEGDDFIARLE
ncbi:hypothetical protein BT96DRAFT_947205 [Gymnopus androsaceus JB14]|uniref:Uncharacterized protein n=1 Tax=Gymnopus androsaceus JB14 TaxID=1447944 RepID=A0A6A4GT84_9AGAR|nr:hypothetical protein BT96DRAFT_947205 [Gymnopus androsaceus JB14]